MFLIEKSVKNSTHTSKERVISESLSGRPSTPPHRELVVLRESTRLRPRRGSWLLATIMLVACSGSELVTDPGVEEEISGDGTPPPVGAVIAQDSIDVVINSELVGTDFVVGRRFTGLLPTDLGSTAGRQLVLVVRDLSNPDVVCDPGLFNITCAHGRDRRHRWLGATPRQAVTLHVDRSRDVLHSGELHTRSGAAGLLTHLPRGRVRPLVEHGLGRGSRAGIRLRNLDLVGKGEWGERANRVGIDRRGRSRPVGTARARRLPRRAGRAPAQRQVRSASSVLLRLGPSARPRSLSPLVPQPTVRWPQADQRGHLPIRF